jgi:hypothetical protein
MRKHEEKEVPENAGKRSSAVVKHQGRKGLGTTRRHRKYGCCIYVDKVIDELPASDPPTLMLTRVEVNKVGEWGGNTCCKNLRISVGLAEGPHLASSARYRMRKERAWLKPSGNVPRFSV